MCKVLTVYCAVYCHLSTVTQYRKCPITSQVYSNVTFTVLLHQWQLVNPPPLTLQPENLSRTVTFVIISTTVQY